MQIPATRALAQQLVSNEVADLRAAIRTGQDPEPFLATVYELAGQIRACSWDAVWKAPCTRVREGLGKFRSGTLTIEQFADLGEALVSELPEVPLEGTLDLAEAREIVPRGPYRQTVRARVTWGVHCQACGHDDSLSCITGETAQWDCPECGEVWNFDIPDYYFS